MIFKKTGYLSPIIAIVLSTTGFLPYPSKAASQDECSIWLCLPSGFSASECGGAKSAMKKRVKKGKSPMPDFGECAVTSPGDDSSQPPMRSSHGVAAYIPAHTTCMKWSVSGGGGRNGSEKRTCIETQRVPEQYVKGTSCQRYGGSGHSYAEKPKGCTSTVNWAEVWQGNQQYGDTYYW
ncbi:conjugal transfer protein TraL [Aeromonas hydrophila]|uniref:conjugal transfer protein TraL n=1 Tax=Aeromonas hydrophila TaxID=644 RepID=UPI002257B69C|nr:conjugal transfer protein TraL [Aeromonas hydrophila]MCX4117209.1 conjugal transfer protein TraL [Aeromonas hydrophila]